MASSRCTKVCPFEDGSSISEEESEDEEELERNDLEEDPFPEHGFMRKLSLWFQRPSNANGLKGIQNIPGNTLAIIDFINLRTHGIETLTRKREKHKSSIFLCNLGRQEIVFCDQRSSQDFFDTGKVTKEPRVGNNIVNRAILDGYTPAMFSNGINHAKRKSFLVAVSNYVGQQFVLPAVLDLVPEHLESWSMISGVDEDIDLEVSILLMADDIICDVFFGTWLDFQALQTWRAALFKKQRSKRAYQEKALDSFHELYHTIVHCPKIKEILIEGRAAGLSYDETVKEIFYAAAYNGTLLSYALTSLFGRLTLMSKKEIDSIKEEIEFQLRDGINCESLQRLQKVEQVVLECLRMDPPAPLVHGMARYEFVTESDSSYYRVKKDQLLACSIYQVQRNPEVFTNPSTFNPSRFEDKCLKNELVVFGGNFEDSPKSQNHKCIGQVLSLTVLKVVLLHLVYCEIELHETPQWSGKKPMRFGRPDKPLDLKKFIYNERPTTQTHINKIMAWDK